MKIIPSSIPDVKIIDPLVHGDERGYFFESYKASVFENYQLPTNFVQDNQAKSQLGVLRGLHYQLEFAQGKLVTVPVGHVWDVAVDLRQSSKTFGQWVGFDLSEDNHRMVYIPEGFAHGYCVLSDIAVFQYKCTEYYHPEDEYGLMWNDTSLNIDWPINDPIISPKDMKHPNFKSLNTENLFA